MWVDEGNQNLCFFLFGASCLQVVKPVWDIMYPQYWIERDLILRFINLFSCSTQLSMVFLKEFIEKVDFEKNQQTIKRAWKISQVAELKKRLDISLVDSLWEILSIQPSLKNFPAENLGGSVLGYHTIFHTKTVNSEIFGGSFIFSNSVKT